jgi:hypothetical protein
MFSYILFSNTFIILFRVSTVSTRIRIGAMLQEMVKTLILRVYYKVSYILIIIARGKNTYPL